MNAVVTNNLTKYYGKARGIVDVSLTVKAVSYTHLTLPTKA